MKRISKIVLINFQKHKRLEIPVGADLTAIIGDNNAGKSSIARSIKWLLTNAPNGTWMQREDTDGVLHTTEIHIWFEDGTKISRIRGKKENKYIMNDQVWEKFGTEVPSPIRAYLGELSLKTGSVKSMPSLHEQDDKAFMVFESGPARGSLISHLTGINIGDKIKRELNKESKDLLKIQKLHEENSSVAELRLSELGNLKKFNQDLKKVEEKIKALNKKKKAYKTLSKALKGLSGIDLKMSKLSKYSRLTTRVKKLSVKINKAMQFKEEHARASEVSQKLIKLQKRINSNKSIKNASESFKKLSKQIIESTTLKASLKDLEDFSIKLQKNLQNTEKNIINLKKIKKTLKSPDFNKCPTCGRKL